MDNEEKQDKLRMEQIGVVINHFQGKEVSQKLMDEFCATMKINPSIAISQYSDYVAQMNHDNEVQALFPLILKEIQGLRYTSMFMTEKEKAKIKDSNDDVRVEVAKLIEQTTITFLDLEHLGDELGNHVGGVIAAAGTTIHNKTRSALLHIAKEKVGGTFTAKHAAEYTEKVYDKATEDKKEASEVSE